MSIIVIETEKLFPVMTLGTLLSPQFAYSLVFLHFIKRLVFLFSTL